MLSFLSVLDFLGFRAENTALFIVLLLFYMIFNHKFELLNKEIGHIKENLGNHVTDTNKRIEDINKKFDKLDSKFDKIIDYLLKK